MCAKVSLSLSGCWLRNLNPHRAFISGNEPRVYINYSGESRGAAFSLSLSLTRCLFSFRFAGRAYVGDWDTPWSFTLEALYIQRQNISRRDSICSVGLLAYCANYGYLIWICQWRFFDVLLQHFLSWFFCVTEEEKKNEQMQKTKLCNVIERYMNLEVALVLGKYFEFDCKISRIKRTFDVSFIPSDCISTYLIAFARWKCFWVYQSKNYY